MPTPTPQPASNAADGALPLERCPSCGYSPEGLPTVHPCPECGLELDRSWTVFGGRYPSRSAKQPYPLMKIFIGVLSLNLICVAFAFYYLTGHKYLFFLPGLLPLVLLPFLYLRRSFVAFGPRGLVIFRGRNRVEQIPWSRLSHARHNLGYKYVTIEAPDGGEAARLHLNEFFYGDPATAALFLWRFNRHEPRES